jgi:hypothetical protein
MNMLNPRTQLACSGLIAMSFAAPAMAQTTGQTITRVEVRHQVLVTEACPTVLEQLPEALVTAWSNIDAPTEVLVDFKLNGSRVDEVRTKGGLRDYHAPIRRAVRNLSCGTPDGGNYAVRFLVKFAYPDDSSQVRMSILHRAAPADQPVLAMD